MEKWQPVIAQLLMAMMSCKLVVHTGQVSPCASHLTFMQILIQTQGEQVSVYLHDLSISGPNILLDVADANRRLRHTGIGFFFTASLDALTNALVDIEASDNLQKLKLFRITFASGKPNKSSKKAIKEPALSHHSGFHILVFGGKDYDLKSNFIPIPGLTTCSYLLPRRHHHQAYEGQGPAIDPEHIAWTWG